MNNLLYISSVQAYDEIGEEEVIYTATPIIAGKLSKHHVCVFEFRELLNEFVALYFLNPPLALSWYYEQEEELSLAALTARDEYMVS